MNVASAGRHRVGEVVDNTEARHKFYQEVAGMLFHRIPAQSLGLFSGAAGYNVVDGIYTVDACHLRQEIGGFSADGTNVEPAVLYLLLVEIELAPMEAGHIVAVAIDGHEIYVEQRPPCG